MQCGLATEWRAVQHAAFVVAQPRLVVSEKDLRLGRPEVA
jgi:hypothetical protein